MYIAFENLELIKVIKKHNDKEIIYKIKESIKESIKDKLDRKENFAIIIEEMGLLEHGFEVVNCATYNSLEEAEKEANMFLDMRNL